MKAHLQHKDSEILWVENIPTHWDMWKVKFVSYYQNGAAFKSDLFRNDGDVFVIRIGDLVGSKVSLDDATTITKENAEGFENVRLKKNDILLALTGATIGKSALFELEEECYLNQRVALFRPRKNIRKEYLMLFIDSDVFRTHIDFECYGGAQENVGKSQILNAKLPLPPLQEQRQIAAYLDYKTKQIDRFIANRKKQIELLEEQKEAIIKKAVTKGIDSAVRLKESNVEYVGRIPEHWAVAKLKHVATVKGRIGYRGYTTADLVDEGNGALTLGATQFDKYGRVDLDKKVFISWDKYYESPEIMIDKGDLIVVQRGSTSGKVGIIDQDISTATINPSIVLIKKLRINRYFLFYYLRAISDEFSYLNVSQTAIPMLSQNQIENIPLLVVPKDEQEQILLYIETELKERNEIITKFQQQIDLMQEYKTSLISKAVTGKIDVREWQPKQILKETV